MPLVDANTPPSTNDTHYVVYFASGEPSWCPDCRDAIPALQAVFGSDSAPTASIVRVGSREEWRGKSKDQNKYRNAPYNIQGVPTVVRVENVSDGYWSVNFPGLMFYRARKSLVLVMLRVRLSRT